MKLEELRLLEEEKLDDEMLLNELDFLPLLEDFLLPSPGGGGGGVMIGSP